jgi:uncharacterized protein YciI
MEFLIICEHTADSQEIRRSVNSAHGEHVATLHENYRYLDSGSFYSDEANYEKDIPHGTMILAEFDSIQDAKAWANADPFATAGVYARVSVYPYRENQDDE